MSRNLSLTSALSLFGVLALIVFLFANRLMSSSKLGEPSSLSETETVMPSAADSGTVPVAPGTDPFKKFLEYKADNSSSSPPAPVEVQPSTSGVPKGVDPFKEFLDKQKQNSKDQVVSPFGKN